MIMLADDPTAAAVLDAVPCYPVPPSGRSPGIDALRASRTGHGFAVGKDGVMMILRRPWLRIDVHVTDRLAGYAPYGSVGEGSAELLCGLIPAALREQILDHFRAAVPNEAAAFIIWNEASGAFSVDFPAIDEATPSRLVYRPPVVGPDCHMICDVHSHGSGNAFFSATDDADDMHATKIALVFGHLGVFGGPTMVSRLCVPGMFLPLPISPFAGEDDD